MPRTNRKPTRFLHLPIAPHQEEGDPQSVQKTFHILTHHPTGHIHENTQKKHKGLLFEGRNGVELPMIDGYGPNNDAGTAGVEFGNISSHPYL